MLTWHGFIITEFPEPGCTTGGSTGGVEDEPDAMVGESLSQEVTRPNIAYRVLSTSSVSLIHHTPRPHRFAHDEPA